MAMTSSLKDEEKIQQKIPKLCLLFKTRNSEKYFFDYCKEEVFTVNHETTEERYFYCRGKFNNNIFNRAEQKDIPQYCDILFLARKSKNGYYELIWPIAGFERTDIYSLNHLNNKMWLIQKFQDNDTNTFPYEIENKPYYLKENDIIKFGEIKYEIINLNIISENNISKNNANSIFTLKKININVNKNNDDFENKEDNESEYNQEKDCRICYNSECTKENPLFKMCNCNTYIHVNCLKKFLNDNKNKHLNENEKVISYKFDNFGCEVCLKPYPLNFIINYNGESRNFCLVDGLNQPENTNYMILESLTRIKHKKNIKNIFVVELIDSEITVGKMEDNDIIINDDTISRYHAIFEYDENNGNISIINKGRYGTSILIKNNVKLNIGEKIYLQIGRTYIEAEVKELSPEEKEELKKKEKNKPNLNNEKEENYDSISTQETNW